MTKIEDLQEKIIKEQEVQIQLLNRLLMQEQIRKAKEDMCRARSIVDEPIFYKEKEEPRIESCGETVGVIFMIIFMLLGVVKAYELLS